MKTVELKRFMGFEFQTP